MDVKEIRTAEVPRQNNTPTNPPLPQPSASSPSPPPRQPMPLSTILFGLLSAALTAAAVIISNQSLQTSKEALKLSDKSLKIGQKAYLNARFHWVSNQKFRNSWFLQVEFRNTGNTPATIKSIELYGDQRGLKNTYRPLNFEQNVVIGSKDSETVSLAQVDLSPETQRKFSGQCLSIPWLSVRFSYQDVFAENTQDARWGTASCAWCFTNKDFHAFSYKYWDH
jgi:hypothetical protein